MRLRNFSLYIYISHIMLFTYTNVEYIMVLVLTSMWYTWRPELNKKEVFDKATKRCGCKEPGVSSLCTGRAQWYVLHIEGGPLRSAILAEDDMFSFLCGLGVQKLVLWFDFSK